MTRTLHGLARLIAMAFVVTAPAAIASAEGLADLFEETPLPAALGLDFPMDTDIGFPEIPEELARELFFQDFHGERMYAVGRFDLYEATVYLTYFVGFPGPGVDAQYEAFVYGSDMQRLGTMIVARYESRPGWIDGRAVGIERNLSAELSWEQGEVQVLQFDRTEILYVDECDEDECPEPVVTMESPGATLRQDGTIAVWEASTE